MTTWMRALPIAALIAAPAALAQQPVQNQPGMTPDFAAPGQQIPMEAFNLPPNLDEYIESRMGPDQNRLELVKTTLLNAFAQLGFAELVSFEEVGDTYVAVVRDAFGEELVVEIDPMAGELAVAEVGP